MKRLLCELEYSRLSFMKYCLRALVMGSSGEVALTEEEFIELRNAQRTLELLFNLTENYRTVVESYHSLETAKHQAALSSILYSRPGYDDTSDIRVR